MKYRALDGHVLDAVLLDVGDGVATVDVQINRNSTLRRTRIPYLAVDNGVSRGVCFAAVVAVASVPQVPSRAARRAARVAGKAKPGV